MINILYGQEVRTEALGSSTSIYAPAEVDVSQWRMECNDPVFGSDPVTFNGNEVNQILESVHSFDAIRLTRVAQLLFAGGYERVPGTDRLTTGIHMLHQGMLSAHFARQLHGPDARDEMVVAYLNGFNSDRSKMAGGHLAERVISGNNTDVLADLTLKDYLRRAMHSPEEIETMTSLLTGNTYIDATAGAEDTDRASYRALELASWNMKLDPTAQKKFDMIQRMLRSTDTYSVDPEGKHLIVNKESVARAIGASQYILSFCHWLNPIGGVVECLVADSMRATVVSGTESEGGFTDEYDFFNRRYSGLGAANPKDSLYFTDRAVLESLQSAKDPRVAKLSGLAHRLAYRMRQSSTVAFPGLADLVIEAVDNDVWSHQDYEKFFRGFTYDGWKIENSSDVVSSFSIEAADSGLWFSLGPSKPRLANPHVGDGRLTDNSKYKALYEQHKQLALNGFRVFAPFSRVTSRQVVELHQEMEAAWPAVLERPRLTDEEFLGSLVISSSSARYDSEMDGVLTFIPNDRPKQPRTK